MHDIMIEFYLTKRNLNHKFIISRLVVCKKAYDISRKDRTF